MKRERKNYGWDQLLCPYFSVTCRYLLNSYMEENGLADGGEDRGGGVYYRRFDIFLNISYEMESYPKYRPSVVLGIGQDLYGKKGLEFNGVPMWYIIPDNIPARKLDEWTFSNVEELKSVLMRIKNEVLEPYAKPLWISQEKLEKHIGNFKAEFH